MLPRSGHWLFITRNSTGDLNFRGLTSESIETRRHQSASVRFGSGPDRPHNEQTNTTVCQCFNS